MTNDELNEVVERVRQRIYEDPQNAGMTASLLATFEGLRTEDKERLANVFGEAFWDIARSRALKDAKQFVNTRYLLDGAEVTKDGNNTVVGLTGGKGQFDILSFKGGFRANINSASNARQLDVYGGTGGADCVFDILVSSCWADEVTAGRGKEGQQFQSLTGCDFWVVSTIQRAWDGITVASSTEAIFTGAKNFTSDCTVYICPGGGIGQLAISGDSGSNLYNVFFVGSNRVDSFIPGSTTAYACDISGGTKPLYFKDLSFTGSDTSQLGFRRTAGSQTLTFDTCRVGSRLYTTGFTDAGGGAVLAWDTLFPTNAGGQYSADTNSSSYYTRYINCTFDDRVRCGKETWFEGCTHNQGSAAKGIVLGTYSGSTELHVEGSKFRTSAAAWTYYIEIDRASIVFDIQGCTANTGATTAVYVGSTFASDGARQSVVGNSWQTDLGLDNASTTAMLLTYVANDHAGTSGASAPTVNPIIAQGKFINSTFEGNGPGRGYVSFSAGSSMNRVNSVMVSTGAPTHTAAEGQLYRDSSSDTLYQNSDGGTTWQVVGVSGGGAAAPSPHNLVSVHHDGEQDYTNSLYLLGARISTGNLKVYSDAGVTLVGEWDGALGHIGIGAASLTEAGLYVAPTFTAPAGTRYGAEIVPTITYAGASGIAHYGAYIVPNLEINAAATQSGAHHALGSGWSVTDNGAGGTISDLAAWSPIIATAGTVIVTTARAIHVHDALVSGGSIGTYYGIDIPALAAATTNIGIRNLATSRLVGAVTIGSDAAVSTGVELEVVGQQRNQGDITFDGIAAPGTPAADDIVVYNATGTDLLKAKDDNGAVYALTHKHEVVGAVDGTTTTQYLPVRVTQGGTITAVKAKTADKKTTATWKGDIYLVTAANEDTDGGTTSILSAPFGPSGGMAATGTATTTTVATGDWLVFATTTADAAVTFVAMVVEIRYT